jgi:hypothetical protein
MNYQQIFNEHELKQLCYVETLKVQFDKRSFDDNELVSQVAAKAAEDYLKGIFDNPVQYVEIGLEPGDKEHYRYTLMFHRINTKKINDFIDKLGIDGVKEALQSSEWFN